MPDIVLGVWYSWILAISITTPHFPEEMTGRGTCSEQLQVTQLVSGRPGVLALAVWYVSPQRYSVNKAYS